MGFRVARQQEVQFVGTTVGRTEVRKVKEAWYPLVSLATSDGGA